MRIIVHLSDIHFGSLDPRVLSPLINSIKAINPNLVAVSGDLTQRAKSYQFKEAREFLDALPEPQIVVPGNHDVPLYNVFSRFLSPLDKYRRYITNDLRPTYFDDEIAVLGVNTARSWTIKGGRINEEQVSWLRDKLCPISDNVLKVVVTHHPFDLPEGHDERDLVGRARMAMDHLADCGADLFLAGHLHISHTTHSAKRYKIKGHSALVVQAGTATSTRGRGEANSFNVIHVNKESVVVERFEWHESAATFDAVSIERFIHTEDGWTRLKEDARA